MLGGAGGQENGMEGSGGSGVDLELEVKGQVRMVRGRLMIWLNWFGKKARMKKTQRKTVVHGTGIDTREANSGMKQLRWPLFATLIVIYYRQECVTS